MFLFCLEKLESRSRLVLQTPRRYPAERGSLCYARGRLPDCPYRRNLLLGKDGSLLNFDSSKLLSGPGSQPLQFAFAAFYSDIEHEVLPVESGYRVTFTYNLHLVQSHIGLTKRVSPGPFNALVDAMRNLMVSKDILPKGGALGFGLLYKYPVDPKSLDLAQFTRVLKGNDALIRVACERLGLEISVKVYYKWNDEKFLADDPRKDGGKSYESSCPSEIFESFRGRRAGGHSTKDETKLPILWVTPRRRMMPADTSFMTYGNEYTMKYVYGDLVLIAEFPELEERLEMVESENLAADVFKSTDTSVEEDSGSRETAGIRGE